MKKTTESNNDSSSDDEFLQQAARHIDQRAKSVRSGRQTNAIRIRIADLDADMEPDSRANANINQFRALKHRSQEIQELSPSEERVRALQSKLKSKENSQ